MAPPLDEELAKLEKRKRNNIAVKKNRLKESERIADTNARVAELRKKNSRLQGEIKELEVQRRRYEKDIIKKYGTNMSNFKPDDTPSSSSSS
ncbi:unnamed protein product [Diamesa hyperborea]